MKRQKKSDTSSIKKHLYEGLLIILTALSTYFFLALFTYHSNDPGWSSSGTGEFVANAGGKIGAFFSDFLFSLFGYVAFLFPLMTLIAAIYLFRFIRDGKWENSSPYWGIRFSGFLLLLTTASGLVSIFFSNKPLSLPLGAGGILGNLISSSLPIWLNTIGTELILSALFLVAMTLCTNLSWMTVMAAIGELALWFSHFLKQKWANFREKSMNDVFDELPRSPVRQPKEKSVKTTEKSVSNDDRQKQTILINRPSKPKKAEIPVTTGNHDLLSLSLLDQPKNYKKLAFSPAKLESLSRLVEEKLADFDIEVSVVAVHPGPVITRFEMELEPGLKAGKITALSRDLARSLSVSRVRVVEVIPGKSVVGLELPNESIETVYIRSLLESSSYQESQAPLTLALGKDISGNPVTVDLTKMPHLLVAGTTGSGKSVSLNVMLLSILFKSKPEEVRFIMMDPKMLELSCYDGIPHLLTPVVTDMKEAANAFRWCVAEMERRYRLMSSLSVRNLAGYNVKVKQAILDKKPIPNPLIPPEEIMDEESITYLEPLPFIVVIVDELADMMMVVGKKVEELIARIAQKARAAGIHMILATQRPSVDVITGLIKSNIPTRISFQVSSKIDSRTILDQQGAEQLLGNGDMLYLPPGMGHPIRIHGAFVSDAEVHRVVAELRKQGAPEYCEEILQGFENNQDALLPGEQAELNGEQDPLYDQAVSIVIESRRASISYIQRRLKIGFNRAARLLEDMEKAGLVSEMGTNGIREVLTSPSGE